MAAVLGVILEFFLLGWSRLDPPAPFLTSMI